MKFNVYCKEKHTKYLWKLKFLVIKTSWRHNAFLIYCTFHIFPLLSTWSLQCQISQSAWRSRVWWPIILIDNLSETNVMKTNTKQ